MAWTADDLVAAVRRRAQLPDAAADGAATDADIIEFANEEIALHMVPLVRRSREDYWTTYADYTIVSGTASYRIPERAQASGLRDVTLIDSSGRERSIPRISIEDIGEIQSWGGTMESTKFVMDGPNVTLVPTPASSGYTLRMRYHRSHATLVANDEAARFLTVTGFSEDAIVDSYPSAWDALSDTGELMDLVFSKPPFGVKAALEEALTIQTLAGPTYGIEFLSLSDLDIDENTPAGSFWIALAGETPVVDLPRECWPLLVSAVTGRVLEVIGDRDGAQMSIALYEREKGNVEALLRPRVEGASVKIIDRYSTLRRGGRRWF